MAITAVMGTLFGFIFGAMDIEDIPKKQTNNQLSMEQFYCFPLGIIFGFILGTVNEY